MRTISLKRLVVLCTVSLLLGLVIIRSHTQNDVPAYTLFSESVRDDVPVGDITVKDYGFPLEYRQTQTFRANGAGDTVTQSVKLGTSVPSIVMNTIFWFALLHLLSGLIRPRSKPALVDRETVSKPVAN